MTSHPPLSDAGRAFVTDRHLATLSTIGRTGLIHAVAVGFTWSEGVARITTSDGSQKVRNIERDPRATLAQVEGPHWLSFAGRAEIVRAIRTRSPTPWLCTPNATARLARTPVAS